MEEERSGVDTSPCPLTWGWWRVPGLTVYMFMCDTEAYNNGIHLPFSLLALLCVFGMSLP